jgi:hypothetical protein
MRIDRLEPEHQRQRLRGRSRVEVTFDDRLAVAIGCGEPLAHVRAAGGVLEDDAAAHESNRLEASCVLRERTASDFRDRGRRLTRVVERQPLADLPPGIEPVDHPHPAGRLGQR